MKSNTVLVAFFLRFVCVENRMLPSATYRYLPTTTSFDIDHGYVEEGDPHETIISLKSGNKHSMDPDSSEDYSFNGRQILITAAPDEFKNTANNLRKCAVIVISNQGHSLQQQQSLLRKYRYNKNGDLIPSSVQYFIKFPQGKGSPVLVPLKDKAFSPSGGFVRYYKEVPPIPQSWKR